MNFENKIVPMNIGQTEKLDRAEGYLDKHCEGGWEPYAATASHVFLKRPRREIEEMSEESDAYDRQVEEVNDELASRNLYGDY